MDGDLTWLFDLSDRLGVVLLLVIIAVAFLREWVVPGSVARAERGARERLETQIANRLDAMTSSLGRLTDEIGLLLDRDQRERRR